MSVGTLVLRYGFSNAGNEKVPVTPSVATNKTTRDGEVNIFSCSFGVGFMSGTFHLPAMFRQSPDWMKAAQ